MKKFRVILIFVVSSLIFAQEMNLPILDLKTESLLGSTKSGKFYTAKETYANIGHSLPHEIFSIYDKNNVKEKTLHIKSLKYADEYCRDSFPIITSSESKRGIALSNKIDWDAIPRKIKPLATNSEIYNEVVKDFLIAKGIKSPTVTIRQIYRSDLDNDGQEEVIIAATHSRYYLPEGQYFNKRYAEFGDYSFVMIRNSFDGKVNNILLGGSFQTKKHEDPSEYVPYWYDLSSVLDLNGDSTMEIIINSSYYEGSFTTAYELKNGEVKIVLETGCGS